MEETKPKEEKIIKYDLACGDRKCSPDFIGVDIAKTESADIVHNLLQFPYTFAEDNSVDELYAAHFLEHIPQCYWNEGNEYTVVHKDEKSVELFEKFMLECHRILKPGGKFTIVCPYYNSSRCWQDPTHRRAINEASFLYFNRDWRKANKLEHCHADSDFDYSYGYNIGGEWQTRNRDAQVFAIKHYMNVADDIVVTLTKK